MTKKPTGGSAFPPANHDAYGMGPGTIDDTGIYDTQGMTLRDWFAGQALAGILAFPGAVEGDMNKSYRSVVYSAYGYADAMLKERSK